MTDASPSSACEHCGAPLESDDRYCGRCGARTGTAAWRPSPSGRLAAEVERTSGKAIGSLAFGLGGFLVVPVACSVVAVMLGHQARNDMARDPSLGGGWMATAGLVLGYLGIAIGAIVLFLFIGLVASVAHV